MGLAVPRLGGVAIHPGHRAARHGAGLAPPRLPALFWRWKSRPNPVGRPRLDAELRDLIRRMARENPTWGRRRIRAELALLGYAVAELTVATYMHRTSPRPSPTWRAFLATHAREIVAVDFFLVPTLTFRLRFVFIGLRHDRRELIYVNVTDHPTACWAARQLIEAFPEETATQNGVGPSGDYSAFAESPLGIENRVVRWRWCAASCSEGTGRKGRSSSR